MDFGGARKRGRPEAAAFNGNGGFKKSKQELESFTTGIGSKSKPCTKFFRLSNGYKILLPRSQRVLYAWDRGLDTHFKAPINTSGCPFGEGCHFLHYVPGGIKAVAQMTGNNPVHTAPARNHGQPSFGQPSFPDGSSPPAVKSRLCNKYNSAEGCKFGDKCHFAHGEWELGRPTVPYHEDPRGMGPMLGSRFGSRMEPTPSSHGTATSFGANATAKISVAASLAGAIIGKNGVNSKQICRQTGAKLFIREHESDPNSRNIELEGSFDQIKQASQMVQELIVSIGSVTGPPPKSYAMSGTGPANNFKTKLCENFAKGSCTFGDRCHFAHGAEELRKSGI